jgi:predicted metal-dependent peptidase
MWENREKILNKAKIGLMDPSEKLPNANPIFYSSILFSLKISFTDKVPTAGVDGKNLVINPDWFCPLKPKEQVGLLAHEALHIAFRHIDYFRYYNLKEFSPAAEHYLWNVAGDHVINLALLEAGYHIPPGGCADMRFHNMSTLQVYRVLHSEYDATQPQPQPGDGDIIFPEEGNSAKEERAIADLRAHITEVIGKAAITSKMGGENPGAIPGGILRTLDEVLNPLLPFEVILANYMSVYAKDDYTYRRPNRRFLPDVYLPSAYGEHLCNIACVFDVSGSVTNEELSSFGRGVRTIAEQLKPEKITLVEFDTEIRGIRDITASNNVMDVKFSGGGGTIIKPVMKWIQKNKPEVTLIFSDGDFRKPDVNPGSDIIWIIHSNPEFTAPFGKVIHYKLV